MILVDDRDGSKELLKPLQAIGLPAEISRLHAGDLAFEGKGEKGKLVSIGVEHKRLDSRSSDLIQSLRTGRLAGEQLQKMLGPKGIYDYGWLIVQGQWKTNPKGEIIVYKGPALGWRIVPGKMTEAEMMKHLTTLDICAGLRTVFTESVTETARFMQILYRWWTDKALDEHMSHMAVHNPAGLVDIGDERRALCMWPGIGVKTSKAVLDHFGSIRRAATAGEIEWSDIQTFDNNGNPRRLGMSVASKIVSFLKGGH